LLRFGEYAGAQRCDLLQQRVSGAGSGLVQHLVPGVLLAGERQVEVGVQGLVVELLQRADLLRAQDGVISAD